MIGTGIATFANENRLAPPQAGAAGVLRSALLLAQRTTEFDGGVAGLVLPVCSRDPGRQRKDGHGT